MEIVRIFDNCLIDIDFEFVFFLLSIRNYGKRKSHRRQFLGNIQRISQSICLFARFIFQLFVWFDQFTRRIFLFVEQICQIIRVVHGWIQLIRAILSFLHLITNRLMLISAHIHRLCRVITILLQPLYNGTFERGVRSFSHSLFYYYSSNGACYTLQDRTRQIARKVKAQWTKNYRHIQEDDDDDEEEIFYDALDENSSSLGNEFSQKIFF